MDPYYHGKQVAVDVLGASALVSLPFWEQVFDGGTHVILILLAVSFGVLRVLVAWRDYKNPDRIRRK